MVHYFQGLESIAGVIDQSSCDEVHSLHVAHLSIQFRITDQYLSKRGKVLSILEGRIIGLSPRQIFFYLPDSAFPFTRSHLHFRVSQFRLSNEVYPLIHPDTLGLALTPIFSSLEIVAAKELLQPMAFLHFHRDICDTGVMRVGKSNRSDGFLKIRILETNEQL